MTLIQGLSRGPKMDLVMQKVTEIGVRRITPVVMKRSVVSLDPVERWERADRWRKIVAEAAKQSQRATVPTVDEPVEFEQLAARARTRSTSCSCRGRRPRTRASARRSRAAGATGTTSVGRRHRARGRHGGGRGGPRSSSSAPCPVTLGPTILRTETAGIVAVALASYELGGLGGARAVSRAAPRGGVPHARLQGEPGRERGRSPPSSPRAGCALAAEDEADVVVVNTCTVTGEADRKARKEVRRALRAAARPASWS